MHSLGVTETQTESKASLMRVTFESAELHNLLNHHIDNIGILYLFSTVSNAFVLRTMNESLLGTMSPFLKIKKTNSF